MFRVGYALFRDINLNHVLIYDVDLLMYFSEDVD